jgi:GNAT superfamily N-acetyltransferase
VRLAALADAPGDATTTLARTEAHGDDHWAEAAAANASGPLQATFFAEVEDREEPVGVVGAYANRDGVVNLFGLWSAPGHRDVGVADDLIRAVADWARAAGAKRLRHWVVERNEFARRYYEGQGFRPTGQAMPFEPDPRLRQVEMVLEL